MKKLFVIFAFSLLLFGNPLRVVAQDNDRFITIVNPVRISSYTKNPAESLKSEYAVIKENDLPATWLLTYDALENNGVVSVAKNMDKKQEYGIFLEVSPTFANEAGIVYHNTGFWHHAASVFLSGYTQEERKLLIDKVFETFREVFGDYPKSVGSWWTDSFSLSYMKEKYGIMANLVCSDQFSTDGYQIWGQPWMLPYYPSKFHSAVPATDESNKLDIVNIQWAPRDPLGGYESSLYSTQDYLVAPKPQDINFFKKLVKLYSSYGQITVGLEADTDPSGYKDEFAKQMEVVSKERENGVSVSTMSEFSGWYREKYPNLSPSTLLESQDLLATNTKSFWYIGVNYRLFYVFEDGKITIKDLRIYDRNMEEPYYDSPNRSFNLSISIPFVISTLEDPQDAWELPEGSQVVPERDKIVIKGKNIKIPTKVAKSGLISLEKGDGLIEITFPREGIIPGGYKWKDFSVEAIHFFKQKKATLCLLVGRGWNYFKKVDYLIPQGEVYALWYLKTLPVGKVMLMNNECLQCDYHTRFPPPAFANRRSYVKKLSAHSVVFNSSVFYAKTREEARGGLKKTHAKYIYLVKFEDYVEKLPFSPGDLGVEKIFANANAEIWRVK